MMIYEYDPDNSIIHLRASGVVVASDAINYFHQLDSDPLFRPKAEERIYFDNVDDIKFTFMGVLAIRDAFVKYGHGEKLSHGTFVVDSDFTYGMARMVMRIFEGFFDNFSIERCDEPGT